MKNKVNYEIISSSSKGNCIVLNNNILLDCGIAYKHIIKYINNIKIIFISHRHSDHLRPSTIKMIAYQHPNIKFVVAHYLVKDLLELGVLKKNILCITNLNSWYDIGIFKIKLDMLIHDEPNCSISIDLSGYKVFYATDTSTLDYVNASGYDLYFIEANYETDEEIQKSIDKSREEGKFNYLERVRHTHLSQLQALDWLNINKSAESVYIFIHQHIEEGEK